MLFFFLGDFNFFFFHDLILQEVLNCIRMGTIVGLHCCTDLARLFHNLNRVVKEGVTHFYTNFVTYWLVQGQIWKNLVESAVVVGKQMGVRENFICVSEYGIAQAGSGVLMLGAMFLI